MIALLEYRNTPIDGYSPAQMLTSRSLKSKLPTTTTLLKPHFVPSVSEHLALRQMKQKMYQDNSGKCDLPSLDSGERVKFLGP